MWGATTSTGDGHHLGSQSPRAKDTPSLTAGTGAASRSSRDVCPQLEVRQALRTAREDTWCRSLRNVASWWHLKLCGPIWLMTLPPQAEENWLRQMFSPWELPDLSGHSFIRQGDQTLPFYYALSPDHRTTLSDFLFWKLN